MSFIKEVIEDSLDIWEGYLRHSFVQGVVKGDLDSDLFKNYIVEDSIYLKEYAKVFACGMYRSKTLKDIQLFYKVLGFVQDNENSTRSKYVKQFGLTDDLIEEKTPRKENQGYIDFMHSIAKEGDVLEILMAVLPCVFSYCYIFRELVDEEHVSEEHPYSGFLNDYISERYLECCNEWGIYTNKLAESMDINEEKMAHLKAIFRKSSEHEMNFWDMSNYLE